MSESKKILVGVDGSEGSRHALRWALEEARCRGDSVEVMTTWHLPVVPDISGMAPYPGTALEEAANLTISEVLSSEAAAAEGLKVTSQVVQGPAAQALIDASAQADLVVVGRRGHGGFLSLVIGSVAQQVSAHAHCPVVIVAGS